MWWWVPGLSRCSVNVKSHVKERKSQGHQSSESVDGGEGSETQCMLADAAIILLEAKRRIGLLRTFLKVIDMPPFVDGLAMLSNHHLKRLKLWLMQKELKW